MTRKQFHEYASRAKPGEVYRIKRARHWERLIGWGGHYWVDATFVSFDGNSAIFMNNADNSRRIYVTHRQIKSGEAMVVWSEDKVMKVNRPAAMTKEKVVGLWGNGAYKHY